MIPVVFQYSLVGMFPRILSVYLFVMDHTIVPKTFFLIVELLSRSSKYSQVLYYLVQQVPRQSLIFLSG